MWNLLRSIFGGTNDYDYVSIKHGERTIAHVFVAPQDLKGLSIGYIDPVKNGAHVTIGGDIEVGNPKDGTYTIPFELTFKKTAEGMLLLGEQEWDLKRGRAFVVTKGYKIVQLPSQSKEEAQKMLPKPGKR